jgi:RNA polymerase sigma-70 factor, ECF subfamily
MTEAELARALKRGDPEAVGALYMLHDQDVLRWVVRLGGPDLDHADVAHEVFVVAIRAARSFRGDARLRTWLFGLTRRVVANARRRAAIRRFVGLEVEPADPQMGADGLSDRRRVQRCLERLPTDQREVLVLSDLEGYTAPEVAELLQIPAGTVYSRLHGARKAFAAALTAAGLGPDGRPSEDGTVVPLRGRR